MNDSTEMANPIRCIDSHTEGEPTRVIVDGGPHIDPVPYSPDRFNQA